MSVNNLDLSPTRIKGVLAVSTNALELEKFIVETPSIPSKQASKLLNKVNFITKLIGIPQKFLKLFQSCQKVRGATSNTEIAERGIVVFKQGIGLLKRAGSVINQLQKASVLSFPASQFALIKKIKVIAAFGTFLKAAVGIKSLYSRTTSVNLQATNQQVPYISLARKVCQLITSFFVLFFSSAKKGASLPFLIFSTTNLALKNIK